MEIASYETQLQRAAQFIREHDDFLVVSHVNPDGDAIGSTCAVGCILQQLGKTYVLANQCEVPRKFQFLKGAPDIVRLGEASPERTFPYVITVDCADEMRIGDAAKAITDQALLLNIDHHSTNDGYGDVQLISKFAAATAEVLFDLVHVLDLPWDSDLAACVYTGLLTDTGGFRYSNTSPKVMKIASELLSHGINPGELAEKLLEKVTFPHVLLLKRALSSLSFTSDRKIAWICASLADIQETGASPEDMEGLVNYPRNIEGVEVGLLFKQMGDDEVKISFRSSGSVDVSLIAKSFGGGGHMRASGATVRGTLQDVTERVVQAVNQAIS